jgi:NTP pyrophosphatase (non-canonical NTP hydrolase)
MNPPLTIEEYQLGTAETAVYPGQGEVLGLLYVGLGLGEAGELQGKIKKILRDDNGVITDEKREVILDELGDVLWYCARIADELGTGLEDVAMNNLAKLHDRAKRGVLKGSGDNR